MRMEIVEDVFDPWRVLSEYKPGSALRGDAVARAGEFGAVAVFVGTMRDFNQGDAVKAMHLEHYPGMTDTHMERAVESAAARYAIGDVLLVHRVGAVLPGEAIVLVAVWAAHRGDAYGANRHIMEALKTKVPFWKRESLDSAARWVEQNTPGGD